MRSRLSNRSGFVIALPPAGQVSVSFKMKIPITHLTCLLLLTCAFNLDHLHAADKSPLSHEDLFAEGRVYTAEIHRLAQEYRKQHGEWPSSFKELIKNTHPNKATPSIDWSRCKKANFQTITNDILLITYKFMASWGEYPQEIKIHDRSDMSAPDDDATLAWLNNQRISARKELEQARQKLLAEQSKSDPDPKTVAKLQRAVYTAEMTYKGIAQKIKEQKN